MKLKLILSLLVISNIVNAQFSKKRTCSHPNYAKIKTDKFYLANIETINKNAQGQLAVNERAYTQSIHNTIAKWNGGGYYRYDMGTAPGLANITRGNLLRATDRHTGGHSYEELKKMAQDLGTNFNIGDTFYISLYNQGSDVPAWSSEALKFKWENLGDSSYNVTVVIETNYGYNGAPAYTNAEANKMMAFYNLVNPIIKEVYGPPSRNHVVSIVNDAVAIGTNTYFNGPNEVTSSFELNAEGDFAQPRLMIHELVHAYRDNVGLSSNDEWHYDPTLSGFEEGMAESVAIIVMDIFIERHPNFFNGAEYKIHWSHARGMNFDWDYDFQNHKQLTTTDFFSSDVGTGAHAERYGTSQAAMRKLYIEDNTVFKNFNSLYYSMLNSNNSLVTSRNMIVGILSNVIDKVERTPTLEWINNQRVLDCEVVPGKKIHMLTYHSANPPRIHKLDNRIHALDTQNLPGGNEWSWDEIDPLNDQNSKKWYIQTNNLVGELQIYNYDNTLNQTVAIRNDKMSLKLGLPEDVGPNQGPNNMMTNGVFTGNEGANDCDNQPGCGKRPDGIETHDFISTSTANRDHGDLPNNLPDKATQLVSGLTALGLYRYDISFTGGFNETFYRINGQELVGSYGIYGGIKSNEDTVPIKGKLVIEHEDYNEEPEIIINDKGAFISEREWASVLEANPNRQGGRSDRRYSVEGKVHAIYISEDCAEHKIDFRTISYGDGLSGSQLFLFNVDDFEDIEFKVNDAISICEGDSFTLDVENNFPDILNNDSRIKYKWLDPSGNEISTNVTHTIAQSEDVLHEGVFTLEIDFFECLIIKTVEVEIDNADFQVTTPDELIICEGENIDIQVNTITDAAYNWIGPNGFTATTDQIIISNVALSEAGTYTVEVTAPGCGNSPIIKTSSTEVVVTPETVIILTTDDVSACGGEDVVLTVNEIAGVTYSWSGPNGFAASTREATLTAVTPLEAGTYTVTATGVACDGTSVVETSAVLVEVDETVTIMLTTDDISTCEGEDIVLTVNEIAGVTYSWSGPNGFAASTREATLTAVTPLEAGTYTVTATGVACDGTSVVETSAVLVEVDETVTIMLTTDDISTCEGEDIVLTVNEIAGVTYSWSGPNGFTASTREVALNTVTLLEEGVYTVTVIDTNCDGSSVSESATVMVLVEPISVLDLSNIKPEVRLCEGDDFIQKASLYPYATYVWIGPNNFLSETLDLSLFDVTEEEEGVYTLIVNLLSCHSAIQETASIHINIDSCLTDVSIPSYFTPNGDGFHDKWVVDSDVFAFETIYIFDRYGKLLKELSPNKNSWDGMYNGKLLPSSDYWYVINFNENNKKKFGHFSLKR